MIYKVVMAVPSCQIQGGIQSKFSVNQFISSEKHNTTHLSILLTFASLALARTELQHTGLPGSLDYNMCL